MRGLVAVVSQTKLMKDGLFWSSLPMQEIPIIIIIEDVNANRMIHTGWLIPTLKKDDGSSDFSATSKVWIKPGLHRTVSKKTIEAGIHGPFSLRTARSELVRDFLNWFWLVRPDVSNSELALVRNSSIFPIFRWLIWSWTDRFWSLDPWSRAFMIMCIV